MDPSLDGVLRAASVPFDRNALRFAALWLAIAVGLAIAYRLFGQS